MKLLLVASEIPDAKLVRELAGAEDADETHGEPDTEVVEDA
jgi:hypothetical protein